MPEFLNKILTQAKNIPGWKTNRKILVIESDDWGTIRMPGRDVLSDVLNYLPAMRGNDFYRYDTLAARQDLDDLFNVLESVKDEGGRSACLTPFCNVANPDFEKIRQSGFAEYFYEPFTATLERYYPAQNVFACWKKGMQEGVWAPEYHGREHINVPKWLKLLGSKDQDALYFFDRKMAHFPFKSSPTAHFKSLAPTYYYDAGDEIEYLKKALVDGLKLFRDIFGADAKSFCPPNALFSRELETSLSETHLKGIVVERNRVEPSVGNEPDVKNYLFKYGVPNDFGQVYYRRNSKFEPIQKSFSLNKTLYEVGAAFRWGKPAIISTHRINFVSGVNADKKGRSLVILEELLKRIVATWGDVEFMPSGALSDLIAKERLK